MSVAVQTWLAWAGTVMAGLAAAYAVLASFAVRIRVRSWARPAPLPKVTVLKPLCGAELDLYECLRSFCTQDYPHVQIICGVRDADDPAVATVRALQCEFPTCDLRISINSRQHGSNRKISNLINMLALARHDHLVIADSDVVVQPGYLASVVAPLNDPGVGIVTCAYRGRPRAGIWSLLGSFFINEWFIPSVRVASVLGSQSFAFGATIAMRREVLADVGGFAAIADHLADDYRLGELTRRIGLRTVLSDVIVDTCVHERSLGDLVRHELRWLRTIRAARPAGYALCFPSFSVPTALLGCTLAGGTGPALALLLVSTLARLMLHFQRDKPCLGLSQLWVLPLHDLMLFVLWCWGFVGRRVHWRDSWYRLARDGSVIPIL
jgi:ceramide glucosyltransferase